MYWRDPEFVRVVSIVCVFYLPAAFADTPGDDHLEEVIVTADPLGEVDAHLVRPVQVLGEEELQRRSIRNIGDTVSNELGVTSSDFGPAVGRPIIRGLASSRVTVLENGISTMDISSISVDHAVSSEPGFARQVEIFRGPATLLYGSGASGGVVNIVNDRIPKQAPERIEGKAALQYETISDGVTGGGSVNAGTGPLALHVDGMVRDTGNYGIPGFAESEPDEPGRGTLENSDTESHNVAGGLSYIGDRAFLGFAVNRYMSNYGVPGAHHHEEEGEEEEAGQGGVRVDMDQTRYDLEAAIDEPLTGLRRIKTRWAYNDYAHDEVEPGGEIGTQFDNDELEGRVELIHDPVGAWDGVLGMQYRNKDFAAVGEEGFVPESDLESVAVFLLEKGDFGAWHVDLGARYEHQDTGTDTAGAEHDAFSLSGGLNWDYAEDYKLGLAVTHAQRAPALEELYANGPHLATSSFEIGDPDLNEEKSTNIDVYWHKTAGRVTFQVNLFYNHIDDFVFLQEQDLNGDGVADRVEEDFSGDPAEILDADEDEEPLLLIQSQQDAHFHGFELEGVARLFEDHRGVLDARLWMDYVDGERDGGTALPRIPPWRIGAGLEYLRGPWTAELDYTRVAPQDDTAPLETETAGYDLLNVNVGYTFRLGANDVTVFARGTNLLDEEIRRHTSFVKHLAPQPGRSGLIGIRTAF